MVKTMKKTKVTLISLLLVIIIFLTAVFLFTTNGIKVNKVPENTVINIEKTMGSKDVFEELEKLGVINNGDVAYYYSRFMYKSDFKAGSYYVPNSDDIKELIDYLSNASNAISNTCTITFIEGDWMKDFANKFAQNTDLSVEELFAYWDDEEVLLTLIDEYEFLTDEILNENIRHPLEGYFFPETYEFYIETTPEAVTKRLLDQTELIYKKYEEQIKNSNLSVHEIFTLASVVQYEAGNIDDMRGVAGVFFNRLNDGMRLQSSVTVCYAIDIEPDEDWVACEINSDYDNPYNTYMNDGLPPGPILNPGEEAISAVLNPESNDYYYFIGDVCSDGTVYFASTYEEHLANVDKYLWCY